MLESSSPAELLEMDPADNLACRVCAAGTGSCLVRTDKFVRATRQTTRPKVLALVLAFQPNRPHRRRAGAGTRRVGGVGGPVPGPGHLGLGNRSGSVGGGGIVCTSTRKSRKLVPDETRRGVVGCGRWVDSIEVAFGSDQSEVDPQVR